MLELGSVSLNHENSEVSMFFPIRLKWNVYGTQGLYTQKETYQQILSK